MGNVALSEKFMWRPLHWDVCQLSTCGDGLTSYLGIGEGLRVTVQLSSGGARAERYRGLDVPKLTLAGGRKCQYAIWGEWAHV